MYKPDIAQGIPLKSFLQQILRLQQVCPQGGIIPSTYPLKALLEACVLCASQMFWKPIIFPKKIVVLWNEACRWLEESPAVLFTTLLLNKFVLTFYFDSVDSGVIKAGHGVGWNGKTCRDSYSRTHHRHRVRLYGKIKKENGIMTLCPKAWKRMNFRLSNDSAAENSKKKTPIFFPVASVLLWFPDTDQLPPLFWGKMD